GDVWSLSRKYKIPLEKIVDFSAPINYLGPSPKAIEAVKRFVDVMKFYPDQNPIELKMDICDYVKKVPHENVILGSGSMELIYLFVEVFAPGWEVVIPIPSFTEYERASLVVSAKPKMVETLPDFSLDIGAIKRKINGDTRLLFICNPHSPSGRLLRRELILDLVDYCKEKKVYVIVDENYIDFIRNVEEYTLVHYVSEYENLFVVRSFSKFFGMPGIRIGYGIGCKKLIQTLEAVRQPWCINSLAIIAAREALKDTQYIEKTKKQVHRSREQLLKLLGELDMLKVFPSETNFLLVKILKSDVSARDLKEELEKKGILIRDCGDFLGLDDSYFRITVRNAEENMILVERLKEFLFK
ncbi:MAG: histidinol-phosphate transaminase, partial [Candidatus Bathyarchaeia archaeon]